MNIETNTNNIPNESFNLYIQLAKNLSLIYPESIVMSSKKSPQLIQIQFYKNSISLMEVISHVRTLDLSFITFEVMNYKEGLLLTFITK